MAPARAAATGHHAELPPAPDRPWLAADQPAGRSALPRRRRRRRKPCLRSARSARAGRATERDADAEREPDPNPDSVADPDRLGLTALEKTATIRDLLSARSGVYHPSVHDTQRGRPARGAHPPGTHWFYNNWDFNALGAIFNRLTGADLFEAFAERIAGPLGMQDFHTGDCRYQHGPESLHPVYKMRLSARDLARFGQLYLNGGAWIGRRILDRDWIAESTRSHSPLGGGRGYGYLWWTAEPHAPGDALSVDTAIYYASGYGGQYIVVVPDLDAVVVHRAANVDNGIDHASMGRLLSLAIKALREDDR